MGNFWNTFELNSNNLNAVLQDCRFVMHPFKCYFKGTKMQVCHQVFLTILHTPLLALGNQPFSILHLNAQSL
jgi:hypothetical protein